MIDQLIELLQGKEFLLSDHAVKAGSEALPLLQGEDIADMLWLADQFGAEYLEPEDNRPESDDGRDDSQVTVVTDSTPAAPLAAEMSIPPAQATKTTDKEEEAPVKGVPIQVEAAPALPNRRKLAGSLRPLMRKVPSRTRSVLDATATVNCYAQQRIWMPILQPARERWFELELVIEASRFGFVWEETLDEFQQMLAWQGAFRRTRTWVVEAGESGKPRLLAKRAYDKASLTRSVADSAELASRSEKELVDASGRRLVLYVSDCRSKIWQSGQIHEWLELWAQSGPTAVVQLLPGRLWAESELDVGLRSQVSAFTPGVPNDKLQVHLYSQTAQTPQDRLTLPIVTLTPGSMLQWAKVVTAAGRQRSPARLFDMDWVKDKTRSPQPGVVRPGSTEARVDLFRSTASEEAQRLAGMMAAVPVDMAVVNMIRQELLPEVEPVHVAEVFDSGLLKPVEGAGGSSEYYEFETDIRRLLNVETPLDETLGVIEALSQRIAQKLGFPIKSFTALLLPKSYWQEGNKAEILPFAQITTGVLRHLGGEYAELAAIVEADAQSESDWIVPTQMPQQQEASEGFPDLEMLPFEYGLLEEPLSVFPPPLETVSFPVAMVSVPQQTLETFEFQTATLELKRSGLLQRRQWVVTKRQMRSQRLIEPLGESQRLEIVAIPAGTFLMGSPEDEPDRRTNEGPQHEVNVPSFFMGRYPVTQAQWRFVASLPQVKRSLTHNPSRFEGDNRPVEQVSWYDTVEFCDRLSAYTDRQYRLPSEAEWEYACRAGTTTPFYFGETITSEVANYNGSYTYADGPKGEHRKETTPVDAFDIANSFGLCDMHGNVFEWCADHYESYRQTPIDGSACITDNESARRICRGGSWYDLPRNCRSAYRDNGTPDNAGHFVGFRVSCSAPRT